MIRVDEIIFNKFSHIIDVIFDRVSILSRLNIDDFLPLIGEYGYLVLLGLESLCELFGRNNRTELSNIEFGSFRILHEGSVEDRTNVIVYIEALVVFVLDTFYLVPIGENIGIGIVIDVENVLSELSEVLV